MNLLKWLSGAPTAVTQPTKETQMDTTTIEKDFETALADAQAALPAIQVLLTLASPFFPQAKVASAVLTGIISVGPTLVADAKKLEADLAPLLALFTQVATGTPNA